MASAAPRTRKGGTSERQTSTKCGYDICRFSTAEKVRNRLGLDAKSMARYLGIGEETYFRRAKTGELRGGESLKIEMLATVLDEATRVLHGEAEAAHWITTPIISLGLRRPIEHLTSINGYERVMNTLAKIEYGMY